MSIPTPRKSEIKLFRPGSSGLHDLQKFNSGCLSLMFEDGTISPFMRDILQNKITFTKQIAIGGVDYNEEENKEECIMGTADGALYRLSLHNGICKVFELDHSHTLLLDNEGIILLAQLPEEGEISLPIVNAEEEKDITP